MTRVQKPEYHEALDAVCEQVTAARSAGTTLQCSDENEAFFIAGWLASRLFNEELAKRLLATAAGCFSQDKEV